MSLVKKSKMTEKQVAANRRNQKLSRGPVTDERRERMRAALRRFGYNVPAEEIAMRALGEEPVHFQELLEGLWEEYNPVGASQEGVVRILRRQAEACEAQRKSLLKESLAGPSPYEFAAEIAPSHADALLMRRTQDANMREVRRLINLLLRIKRYERQMQALEKPDPLHYVSETNGVSTLAPECPKPLSHAKENS
jgi:hypothetical protein